MRVLLLVMLLFSCQLIVLAQKTIKGKVVDVTGEAVPFAHIVEEGSLYGTFSDEKGEFTFTLADNAQKVVCSSTGYQSKTINVAEIYSPSLVLLIELKPSIEELKEVIVRPENMRNVMREVIRAMPTNYHDFPVVMQGLFRGTAQMDKEYVEYTEALIDIYKQPVDTEKRNQLKVIGARSKVDSVKMDGWGDMFDSTGVEFFSPYEMLKTDLFQYRDKIFDKRTRERFVNIFDSTKLDYYHFDFVEMTTYQERSTIVIDFYPRWKVKLGMFRGRILIDEETKGIASLYLEVDKKYLKYIVPVSGLGKVALSSVLKLVMGISLDFKFHKLVGYYEYQIVKGKWIPKYVQHDMQMYLNFKYKEKGFDISSDFIFLNEMFVLGVQTEDIAPFNQEDCMSSHQGLNKLAAESDTIDWEQYNNISSSYKVWQGVIEESRGK